MCAALVSCGELLEMNQGSRDISVKRRGFMHHFSKKLIYLKLETLETVLTRWDKTPSVLGLRWTPGSVDQDIMMTTTGGIITLSRPTFYCEQMLSPVSSVIEWIYIFIT